MKNKTNNYEKIGDYIGNGYVNFDGSFVVQHNAGMSGLC